MGGTDRISVKGNVTFLNLINTSLNHPICGVVPRYSPGKWHLSALMLSFSEGINRFAYCPREHDLLNQTGEREKGESANGKSLQGHLFS